MTDYEISISHHILQKSCTNTRCGYQTQIRCPHSRRSRESPCTTHAVRNYTSQLPAIGRSATTPRNPPASTFALHAAGDPLSVRLHARWWTKADVSGAVEKPVVRGCLANLANCDTLISGSTWAAGSFLGDSTVAGGGIKMDVPIAHHQTKPRDIFSLRRRFPAGLVLRRDAEIKQFVHAREFKL